MGLWFSLRRQIMAKDGERPYDDGDSKSNSWEVCSLEAKEKAAALDVLPPKRKPIKPGTASSRAKKAKGALAKVTDVHCTAWRVNVGPAARFAKLAPLQPISVPDSACAAGIGFHCVCRSRPQTKCGHVPDPSTPSLAAAVTTPVTEHARSGKCESPNFGGFAGLDHYVPMNNEAVKLVLIYPIAVSLFSSSNHIYLLANLRVLTRHIVLVMLFECMMLTATVSRALSVDVGAIVESVDLRRNTFWVRTQLRVLRWMYKEPIGVGQGA
nr:hypothetical protein Iba_chr12cCG15110 [Ipomoea batatas]